MKVASQIREEKLILISGGGIIEWPYRKKIMSFSYCIPAYNPNETMIYNPKKKKERKKLSKYNK